MVKDIIVEELRQGRRIVIPGFGAFIVKGDVIVFVEFLKRDDGVLCSLVESRMGLDSAAAMVAIESFVSTVKSAISSKGDFNLAPLGCMLMDDNGVYVLRPMEDCTQSNLFDIGPSSVRHSTTAPPQSEISTPISIPIPVAVPRPTTAPVTPEPVPCEAVKRPDMRVNVQRSTPTPPSMLSARAQEPPTAFPRVNQRTPSAATTPSSVPTQPTATPPVQSAKSAAIQELVAPKRESGNDMRYQRAADKNGNISYAPPKRIDSIMLIAIIVAVLSIGVMIYGMMSESAPKIELVENPADTTKVK